ncbi:hypothetical protein HD_1422 [[Haemophilus] ducreyi 35000HP]|uniref:Uncharacterized protein n=1 Tax=Haemophilus ducreyi (strain 35000HP / ATCC 700724) TaxID=233412 RepID=Q7VLK7_HAEDU|nr:hypothetical protein HD_1422 [[Haemophilus] ducreyi 35000HP]
MKVLSNGRLFLPILGIKLSLNAVQVAMMDGGNGLLQQIMLHKLRLIYMGK